MRDPLDPTGWPEAEWAGAQVSPGERWHASGQRWAVSTEHPLATLAAEKALAAGGSAADALVTACAVEQVVMPGTATLAGLIGGLYREAGSGRTIAVNAGLQTPAAWDGSYRHERDRESGRAVLVPGALAGLDAFWSRWGRLPWTALWRPAAHLAEHGFPMYEMYR